METNRDHSVVFEIASKYCISESFVDHDGYSISSEGFLPTVVPLIQGKEQWLCFAGAAVKRYPPPKVRVSLLGGHYLDTMLCQELKKLSKVLKLRVKLSHW